MTSPANTAGATERESRPRFFLAKHKEGIQHLIPVADRYISNAALILGSFLLVPVLAIFFLRDGDHLAVIPRILGHELKIHALGAIFAVLVGAELGGVVEIYLAVSPMAAIRVIWRIGVGELPKSTYQQKPRANTEVSSVLAQT